MPDNNNYVRQQEFHQEMKEVRKDLNDLKVLLVEIHSDVKHSEEEKASLKEALEKNNQQTEKNDARLIILESKDKRYIAKVGAVGVVAGAIITGIVDLILAALKS